ncbi:peptide ABC transporter substrate-binding protein [uncultured Pseudoflavonifractor sp.]|uniref:peptide ABC transporter substrate-binding protein n=1 Tax=uncultured Pseudoflavonifractor sp. TaxID=1221379 RepID=UPI0025CE6E9B|nr:peptide ABC transporter substrate-binding protein [uncultured Pseudoflavonifractor sp.]
MKKFTRLLACALSLALLAGCAPSTPSETQTGETGESTHTFTYGLSSEPDYLDPAICMNSNTSAVLAQLYFPLFRYDENGNVQNMACESYTVSDDGLTYTFKLVEGNTWSDGQPVTAADYEYGMKRSIGYGPDSTYAYLLYSTVAGGAEANANMLDVADMTDVGIHALDDTTLEITLAAPCPYFTGLLSNVVAYPLRSDFAVEHESTWANDPAVPTNGAFKLDAVRDKEEVVMTKNEYYVYADQVQTDTLIAKIITDPQAQLSAFQTGELDLALYVPVDVSVNYADDPALIHLDPVVSNTFLWVNCTGETNPALANADVRRALSMAIDREQLLTLIGSNDTKYPLYGYVPKGMADADGGDFRENADNQERYADYDLEQAKALMEAAGYNENNRMPLTISYIGTSGNTDICVALQAMWKEIYVDVELSAAEQKAYAQARKAGQYEVATGSTSADYLDPYYYLERWVSYNQSYKQVNDPTYDSMIEEANAQTDPAKRMEMLHAAEKYLVEDNAYTIPLYGSGALALMNPDVSGLKHDPTNSVYFDGLTY